MKSNYKIIIVITILLLILSVTISVANYMVSLKSTQTHLKTQSLPLSIDNIYTEIQKHLIEPYLVSSMMANDTFLKDWIVHEEENVGKIAKYLDSIKNKYEMLTAFLVSEKSHKYYTHNGYLEEVKKDNPTNQWYFKFKNTPKSHEINLDFNENFTNTLIMFINFKIYDDNYNFIGATGIGIEISYIDEMLRMFKKNYHLNVYFLNEDGKVVLTRQNKEAYSHLNEMKELKKYRDQIISKDTSMIEYEKNGEEYLLKTKYIPELDIYLVVEAKLNDFDKEATQVFYFNLIISLIFTLLFAIIIMFVLRNYHRKLEILADFDSLTEIPNRRNFNTKFEQFLSLHKRDERPICLVFMDIDDFKSINDELGHNIGDEVLIQVAKILKNRVRKTDLLSRWGGEEFTIAFIDTNINDAHTITQKIREAIEKNETLKKTVGYNLTASFGLTACNEYDTIDTVISRADKAMYEAKQHGKNRVVLARSAVSEESS
ncbi:diguanylate cyclase (GGDEF domain) [Sulfurimonas gotlandica GD1]|uniref:diguanylate cyclase n=1 Tax=Sulfurimonas gotlandica (strain DSM 19862 / JCM 16533 / GD1) TaxID=929558 RepID=B6BGG5_SULGG|nr:diguanylate cyclase [Sulfurimonas gotlandica]EDZ63849.1 diguanylate cyclase [Sulfurimonas gotlandica GD1]EHP29593.1 diguanylate cyclase (GGDEF domain) [Sulfurimonas gotlandica GD1]